MTASFQSLPWLVSWRAIPAPVRRLMLGELLGLLAAASMQLTMAWWISGRGGVKDLATYAVFTALAALVATPLLSPAGDRLPKRQLIRLGKLCLVADAALLTVLCLADLYDLRLLCACGLLAVVATALLLPVEASILPELVDTAALPTAIRLRRGAQAVGVTCSAIFGPPVPIKRLGLGRGDVGA